MSACGESAPRELGANRALQRSRSWNDRDPSCACVLPLSAETAATLSSHGVLPAGSQESSSARSHSAAGSTAASIQPPPRRRRKSGEHLQRLASVMRVSRRKRAAKVVPFSVCTGRAGRATDPCDSFAGGEDGDGSSQARLQTIDQQLTQQWLCALDEQLRVDTRVPHDPLRRRTHSDAAAADCEAACASAAPQPSAHETIDELLTRQYRQRQWQQPQLQQQQQQQQHLRPRRATAPPATIVVEDVGDWPATPPSHLCSNGMKYDVRDDTGRRRRPCDQPRYEVTSVRGRAADRRMAVLSPAQQRSRARLPDDQRSSPPPGPVVPSHGISPASRRSSPGRSSPGRKYSDVMEGASIKEAANLFEAAAAAAAAAALPSTDSKLWLGAPLFSSKVAPPPHLPWTTRTQTLLPLPPPHSPPRALTNTPPLAPPLTMPHASPLTLTSGRPDTLSHV